MRAGRPGWGCGSRGSRGSRRGAFSGLARAGAGAGRSLAGGSRGPLRGRVTEASEAAAAEHAKLRVLIVDDHDVVHWGFRLMLGNQPWVERCLSARTGPEAYALATRYKPDVALVDLFMGEESG